jgi:hypothetical protein
MDRRLDPRSIVTPYAFSVHPDLLGMPLATPWQRLGAIVVDLLFISLISQVGVGPLALASAVLLVWMATRKRGRDVFGKFMRVTVGCLGVLVFTVTILIALIVRFEDQIREVVEEAESSTEGEGAAAASSGMEGAGDIGFLDMVQGFQGVAALQRAESREEAQELMDEFVQRAHDGGIRRPEIRDLLSEVLPDDAPWRPFAPEMMERALASLSAPPPIGSPLEEASPGAETGTFSPQAEDSISRLNTALEAARGDQVELEQSLTRAEAALEAERERGPLSWLWDIIDELGIGFGWAALYLTVTHAWWRGTSIGKKLFRIRVVMIDNRPLNWWLSFERAGGYAAGFATGLLGFAQIFWDPNRQAIHDKVSETVVIQDGKKPIPGPWVEEGRAQWQRGRHPVG